MTKKSEFTDKKKTALQDNIASFLKEILTKQIELEERVKVLEGKDV